ncbi:MAG: SocA family protein, partial [Methanobrevibacter sp.]|nr:SocA family protein [Methanobrevibacter sp.]
MEIILNKEKMKEMVHYIIAECENKKNFGKTVLFKLLYFADFDYFELNEKSISGETYQKFDYGPFPKHFDEVKEELINENKIKENKINLFKNSENFIYKYKSIKAPSFKYLSKDEIERINLTIFKLSSMKGGEIRDYSHEDMPWRASKKNQDINYKLVFYRTIH